MRSRTLSMAQKEIEQTATINPSPVSPCKKTGKAQSYCVLPPPCDYLLMISPQSHVFSMIDEQQRRRYALAVGVKN